MDCTCHHTREYADEHRKDQFSPCKCRFVALTLFMYLILAGEAHTHRMICPVHFQSLGRKLWNSCARSIPHFWLVFFFFFFWNSALHETLIIWFYQSSTRYLLQKLKQEFWNVIVWKKSCISHLVFNHTLEDGFPLVFKVNVKCHGHLCIRFM